MGCKRFALLFDDIDDELCFEDKVHYTSPADAQSCLTNTIYEYLKYPDIFLFCPTEYSSNRTEPDLASSSYLKIIGEKLHPKIDILWTGPKVVSQLITVENIDAVSRIVQRGVTIWDNLHANDYDQTRLYLGPYSGRDSRLTAKLRGVLTNPNCEFEANFIAMHSLAQWSVNKCTRFIQHNSEHHGDTVPSSAKMDVDTEAGLGPDRDASPSASDEMESDQTSGVSQYNEKRALMFAVMDWLPELYKTKTSSGRLRSATADVQRIDQRLSNTDVSRPSDDESKTVSAGCESMSQTDVSTCGTDGATSKYRRGPRSDEDHCDTLTVDDVLLMCHMFYLPYEHGPRANLLLQSAYWLLSHVPPLVPHPDHVSNCNSSSSDEDDDATYEWYHRAGQFHRLYREIVIVVDKLVNIPNRELLYELYAYITDMRSTLALVNSYVKWQGTERKTKNCEFKSGDQEPWVYRGGLLGEFRTLLPVDSRLTAKTSVPAAASPPTSSLGPFIVRPYYSTDKADIYTVCEKTYGSIQCLPCCQYPQLLTDWYVEGFLEFAAAQCYVLEDSESSVCGYVISSVDAKEYYSHLTESWIPKLRTRYPRANTDNNEQNLLNVLHSPLQPVPSEVTAVYPSILSVGIVPTFSSVSAVESIIRCACRSLEAQQSNGVYVLLPPGSDLDMLLSHSLGFINIGSLWPEMTDNNCGWKVIGKEFNVHK